MPGQGHDDKRREAPPVGEQHAHPCVHQQVPGVGGVAVEEAVMAGRLGEPYREYAGGTARPIPRVW